MGSTAKNIIRPTVVLVVIAIVISGVVAVVYNLTKLPETIGLSEAATAKATELMGTDQLTTILNDNYPEQVTGAAKTENGEYVIGVTATGYGGEMELVIGFQSDDSIKGVAIVSAQETPGIGTKVTEGDEFTKQFAGLQGAATIGENVDAIAGSTISSKAVTAGVNTAIEALSLVKEGKEQEGGGK